MMWAYSKDGATVDRVSRRVRDFPHRRLDGGALVLGLNPGSPPGLLADCGIFPVEEAPRPSDPDWQWLSSHTIVDGVAVQSWERGESLADENAARDAERAAREARQADRAAKRAKYRGRVGPLRQLEQNARDPDVGRIAGALADLIEAEHPE